MLQLRRYGLVPAWRIQDEAPAGRAAAYEFDIARGEAQKGGYQRCRTLDDTPNLSPTYVDVARKDEAASLAAAIVGVAEGDRRAFGELYRRTSSKLFGVCLRILPTRLDAEEVLQEVYLTVWRRAETFNIRRGSAMTWLMTLARNRCLDRLRSSGAARIAPMRLAEQVPDPSPQADELLDASDDQHRLAECMAELGNPDAGFIRSAFFEGSTYADLAARAGLPLGTLKSRIRRALLRLRDCLE